MDKYIKYDFHNAEVLVKAAINNSLASLELGDSNYVEFPMFINPKYIELICKERDWKVGNNAFVYKYKIFNLINNTLHEIKS